MTDEPEERRRRERVPVRLEVTVCLEGREIPVHSRNLSLKGLACAADERLQKNRCCQVLIRLVPDIRAVIKGRVVRSGEVEAAIDFLAMDLESFGHLRKIVEYHAADPAAISQELLTPAFPLSRPGTAITPKVKPRP